MTLADALVYDAPGEAGEAHWNEEAKALIAGILLWVACDPESQGIDRTLDALRDCLTFAPDNFQRMLREMSRSTQERGMIARAANRYLGTSDHEAAAVLSAVQRHTHFLHTPRIPALPGPSGFPSPHVK